MAVELIFANEVQIDIAEAYAWYEGRRPGLGDEFVTAVEASLERIRPGPKLYPFVHETYRRALTRRFPYSVFYELIGTTVTIYAVFHNARDPKKWRQRLS